MTAGPAAFPNPVSPCFQMHSDGGLFDRKAGDDEILHGLCHLSPSTDNEGTSFDQDVFGSIGGLSVPKQQFTVHGAPSLLEN